MSSNGLISIKCHHDDQAFRQKSYAAVRLLLENKRHLLPLSAFIKMFADKYNDVIDEHLITTMKHAIEVSNLDIASVLLSLFITQKFFFYVQIQYINNMKCVKMTKMMSFVINLIDFIENHGTVKLQNIFNSLKLSVKACFTFGELSKNPGNFFI